jgi:hypothetical protein
VNDFNIWYSVPILMIAVTIVVIIALKIDEYKKNHTCCGAKVCFCKQNKSDRR